MTRDLTAQEYYEIYLRSKQGSEKTGSTQLARGGSFRVTSQTGGKSHSAITRSKSFKVIRFRDEEKDPDEPGDTEPSQKIFEENINDRIAEKLASLKKVGDWKSSRMRNGEETKKERNPSESSDTSRQGASGNVTNLMSITERVKQLTSAMASWQSGHGEKGSNKFSFAKRTHILGEHERGLSTSPSNKEDACQISANEQNCVSGLRNILEQQQVLKALDPSRSAEDLLHKDEADESSDRQEKGSSVSGFDAIALDTDSESLVHLRKYGPKPHKRTQVSRNPVRNLLARTDLKDLEVECRRVDFVNSGGRILQRLSMTDDEDGDGDEDKDSSVENFLLTFCGITSEGQLKKSSPTDNEVILLPIDTMCEFAGNENLTR